MDLDYALEGSLRHSDNIGLDDSNPITEDVLSTELRFRATQVGSAVQLDARGDIAYLDYLGGTYAPETRGSMVGELVWQALPQRMNFVVRDHFTHEPVNALSRFTPDNRQRINVFTAGPSFFIRPSKTTRGELDIRYRRRYAERSDEYNGESYSATAAARRNLNATEQISLTALASENRFANLERSSDYARRDIYGSYLLDLRELAFAIDVGYSWLLMESGDDHSGALVSASVDWRISSRSTLEADARYQFNDTAGAIASSTIRLDDLPITDVTNASLIVAADPFREKSLEFGYRFAGERTAVQLRTYYQRNRYISQPLLDNDIHALILDMQYQLYPQTLLSVYMAWVDQEFVDVTRGGSTDLAFGFGLERIFTRHWSGSIDLHRLTRDSSEADYDENVVGVSITYRR